MQGYRVRVAKRESAVKEVRTELCRFLSLPLKWVATLRQFSNPCQAMHWALTSDGEMTCCKSKVRHFYHIVFSRPPLCPMIHQDCKLEIATWAI